MCGWVQTGESWSFSNPSRPKHGPLPQCLTSPFAPSVHFHNKSLTGCLRLYRRTAEKSVVKHNPGWLSDAAAATAGGLIIQELNVLRKNSNSTIQVEIRGSANGELGIYQKIWTILTPGNVKSRVFHPLTAAESQKQR